MFDNRSRYIRWFEDVTIYDATLVGGRHTSLGEMYRELTVKRVRIPDDFPSDFPEITEFMVKEETESISLNPN